MARLLPVGLLLYCFQILVAEGVNPDILLNLDQLIKKHGYPVELHEVVTDDGYILNLYRIPHGLNKESSKLKNKSALLMVHSQGGAPYNFVALGKKYAPAYYFADRGFDVWLFCARGVECQNPQKHKKFNWNAHQTYWNYNGQHIGTYDLAASIDVVRNKTGQDKIFHLGLSIGAAYFYMLMSERPEYNDKIKLNINYAPMVIMKELDYPLIQSLFFFSSALKNVYGMLGLYESLPLSLNKIISDLLRKMCHDPKWFEMCKVMLSCYGSSISVLIEDEVVEFAWYNVPRLSIIQLTHFMDNLNRGDFRKYDYGPQKNLAEYGKTLPPAYNLSSCTVPNAFFWGQTDYLTMPEDIQATQALLPNVILDYKVGPKFVHLDFLFAKNATHMVYQPTVKLLNDFDAAHSITVCTMKTNIQNLLIVLHCLASLKWNIDVLTTGHFIDPEANLNIIEKINLHGYPVEVHKIITEDDYILVSYRIPYGLTRHPREKPRTPVLINHGMGGSAEVFFFLRSQLSIPYYLADRGFDVWLLNARGVSNVLGDEKHLKYDWDKDDDFWRFSYHEIGVYDLAGNIDYILNLTGQSKVSIIGHSAGGAESFILLCERPEYNKKVNTVISWGSSPILKRIDYPFCHLVKTIGDFLKTLVKRFEMVELFPIVYKQFRPFLKATCADPKFSKLCIIMTGIIGSHRSYIIDTEIMQLIISSIPVRMSTQQVIHFLDNYVNGTFKKFDFGLKKNLEIYGQSNPPHYNLSAVDVPVVFFVADGDSFIQLEDILEVSRQLSTSVNIQKVAYPRFTHIDYILSKNASDLVYESTYRILRDIDRGIVPPSIKVSRKG
ncbi:uncharacterized protein [Euwallacea fornicatus]|uniref:uncharacterized protein n=1 Tax=Euwallacea fornicatus TaxID=995702 RepID=UPI00338E0FE2